MKASMKAGVAYFALVMAAGFVLGTLRVLVLSPALGEFSSVILEVPVMLAVCWFVCRSLISRFAVPSAIAPRIMMGGIAFGLLMVAEVGVSSFLFGRSLTEHYQHLTGVAGLIGLTGQVAFAVFPLAQRATMTAPPS